MLGYSCPPLTWIGRALSALKDCVLSFPELHLTLHMYQT